MRKGADITSGKNVGICGRERGIDHDAAIDRKAGGPCERAARHGTDADQHRIGLDDVAVRQGEREAVACQRDLLQPGVEQDFDPRGGVTRVQKRRNRRRHHPAQEARRQLDHDRPAAHGGRARGDLEADEAAADDGNARTRAQCLAQPVGIGEVAQIQRPLGDGAIQRQPARPYVPAGTIDRQRRAAGTELDARGLQDCGFGEGEVVCHPLAGEIGLGQGRTLVRRARLGAEQDDAAAVAPLAQDERGAPAGLPGADDHDAAARRHVAPPSRAQPRSISTLPFSTLTG